MNNENIFDLNFSNPGSAQTNPSPEFSIEFKESDIENMTCSCCAVADNFNAVKKNIWIDAIVRGDILR